MTELQLYAPPMKNFLNISILFTFMFIYILYLVTYNSTLQRVIHTQSRNHKKPYNFSGNPQSNC